MAIPLRGPAVKPARPAAPPGLTKGMARMRWHTGGREDAGARPARVQRVPGYAPTLGPPASMGGILPTPQVPGAELAKSQRERFLAYVKSSKGTRGRGRTGYDQLLQSVQGGGMPQGPGVQGYIGQLARTLLQGL